MKLKFKKLHPAAIVPKYATAGAACFDLHAYSDGIPAGWILREDGGTATIGTGIAYEVPPDHVMLVFSRSGHGFKNHVSLVNCTGVIDSDFRGEVCVGLRNDGPLPFRVAAGDRIAQAMIVRIPPVDMEETDELSDTARGTGGFGSTGA